MVGGALLGAAANRQVCPTISEMTFGNHSIPPFHEPGFRSSRREEAQTFWKKKIRASSRRLLQFMVPMLVHRWKWRLPMSPGRADLLVGGRTRGSASLPGSRIQARSNGWRILTPVPTRCYGSGSSRTAPLWFGPRKKPAPMSCRCKRAPLKVSFCLTPWLVTVTVPLNSPVGRATVTNKG